jgi:Man1-Src1p-C-terminal domain
LPCFHRFLTKLRQWGTGDESSLWEDNNPFQTGTSAADINLTRSVTKPRKSRTRPSSGIDFAPPKTDQNIFPAAGSLDLGAFSTPARKSRLSETPVRTSSRVGSPATPHDHWDGDETLDDSQEQNGYPYVEGDSQTDILTRKIASLGEDIANGDIVPRKRIPSAFGWRQLLLSVTAVLASTALYSYKTDSAAIGYCDTGKDTNPVVLQHLLEIETEKACRDAVVKRADAGLPVDPDIDSCKTTILPRATECTPCPPHATCSVQAITCEPAYILKHNVLSSLPMMDFLLDGFPGMGSVALPARCVPDIKRRQHVGKMAGAIENKLATVRGDRICAGIVSTGGDAQDAAAYGMTFDDIKTSLSKRINPKAVRD